MITVACVLRSGKRYSAEDVYALRRGVERRLSVKHRFLCLSDMKVPCMKMQLQHRWKRWWSKLELFKLPGPVLYFDLDVLPVGNLDEFAMQAMRSRFTILRDFHGEGFNSSVMSWNASMARLYETFRKNPKQWIKKLGHRGDQGFIEECVGSRFELWQDVVQGKVVSYKTHCQSGVPNGTSIVVLHGRPKFRDMSPADPVRLEWEENGKAPQRSLG